MRYFLTLALFNNALMKAPLLKGSTTIRLRTFRLRHFVYTDISSTTVYQRVGQLQIQLLFQQIIIFINSNFYLHYDSFLSIPLPLTLW